MQRRKVPCLSSYFDQVDVRLPLSSLSTRLALEEARYSHWRDKEKQSAARPWWRV